MIGISVVGDAMARPVIEELERGGHDASSLMAFGSGGATLSVGLKERLLAVLPTVMISDVAGASETGRADGRVVDVGVGVHRDLRPRAGHRGGERRPHARARARRRRGRLAGPARLGAARLPGRRGQDGDAPSR